MNLDWDVKWKEVPNKIGVTLNIGDNHTYIENRLTADEMNGIRRLVIHSLASQQSDWLRSEIEKFEVTQREHFCTLENGNDYDHGAWDVYDSIITRYKEELKVLESKQ